MSFPEIRQKFGKTHVHPPFQIATEFVVTHPASRCTSVLELPGSSGCSTPRSQPVVDWIEAYCIHGISMAKSARNLLWKMEMPFQSMGWLQMAILSRATAPGRRGSAVAVLQQHHPVAKCESLQIANSCCGNIKINLHPFPPSISTTSFV